MIEGWGMGLKPKAQSLKLLLSKFCLLPSNCNLESSFIIIPNVICNSQVLGFGF